MSIQFTLLLSNDYSCKSLYIYHDLNKWSWKFYDILLGYQSGKFRIHWILLTREVVVNVFTKCVNKYLCQTERFRVDKAHACQRTESVHPYNSRCIWIEDINEEWLNMDQGYIHVWIHIHFKRARIFTC